ncbi:MAG TPA: helix-turn-helix domain-containing protein [Pseudolabrys sp.]|nr:helix-turn-helix domain-containing protein [Pseudolabrys sp.]
MNAVEFKRWRKHMRLSQQDAARVLGLSKTSIELYERGSRRDDGSAVVIPKTVELACAALKSGITKYVELKRAPKGTFQVVRIESGPYGEQVFRTDIGSPYLNRSEAESFARNESQAFEFSGTNEENAYWWGRDAVGKVYKFFVQAV